MNVCSTNLQGPHGIPQFPVALKEALLFSLMSPVQRCGLCVMLQFVPSLHPKEGTYVGDPKVTRLFFKKKKTYISLNISTI